MQQFFQVFVVGVLLFLLFFFALRHWQSIVHVFAALAVIGVGLGLAFVALSIVLVVAMVAYEGYKTKQCQTVHERVAKARAAPDDYFGKAMRGDAEAEQASCYELATRLAERERTTGHTNLIFSLLPSK